MCESYSDGNMGADRIVQLARDLTHQELESILNDLKMRFSRQTWGYSSELDVSIVPKGIHLHYGYCGNNHIRNAELRAKQIIRKLRKLGIITKTGKWSY